MLLLWLCSLSVFTLPPVRNFPPSHVVVRLFSVAVDCIKNYFAFEFKKATEKFSRRILKRRWSFPKRFARSAFSLRPCYQLSLFTFLSQRFVDSFLEQRLRSSLFHIYSVEGPTACSSHLGESYISQRFTSGISTSTWYPYASTRRLAFCGGGGVTKAEGITKESIR